MSIRELSAQLQSKAQLELHEVPNRVREDIDTIKEWIHQQTHLIARTDDQWILSFLRGCKFSLERTKTKLISYYTMRVIEPAFFADRDPFKPELQQILKAGFCLPLRKLSDPEAPRVLLFQNKNNEELLVINMIKLTLMILDILINEDDNFVVGGHVVLQDFKSVTLHHLTEISPNRAKNIMNCFQHAYPTRPKQFHYINTPTFFPTLYGLVKHFMTEKIKNRIVIYSESNVDALYQSIPKSILPEEYGGEAGPIQDLIDYWKRKVEDYREWFLLDQQYRCSLVNCQNDNIADTDEIMGSFRKLAVD
ncbi:hypothetical protein RN001_012847 [Aquatica leii]|uniref:CRAL-TRIO domain-containing protein n=1 Tax=Aquatica leii TaxID=1421715 RepID=A0AAN7Q210_9COLE|nr:hypothetical protein RN001_012847 [Aquatica leii]